MELASIFAAMVKEDASDLFLKVGVPPAMRVVGRVIAVVGVARDGRSPANALEALRTFSCRITLVAP